MTSEDQRERENMMIKDLTIKPLGKDMTYREGKVYCKLWDTEIDVALYDEDVTVEYAEKCAEAMNSMSDELIDAICRAAKKFCIEFKDDIDDEWREEIEQKMSVQVDEDTLPLEMLKCFYCALIVEAPEDPSRIGYQLSGNCDWEEEHGIEIDILDGKLVYLSEYAGQSPWDDHSDEEWNYAAHIYEQ